MNPDAAETQVPREQGETLNEADGLRREIQSLRDRLTGLSEASLRITQDLDLDTVLRGVIDGARSLTGARYGALLVFDDSGGVGDLITSGITSEEIALIRGQPRGRGLLGHPQRGPGAAETTKYRQPPQVGGLP